VTIKADDATVTELAICVVEIGKPLVTQVQ